MKKKILAVLLCLLQLKAFPQTPQLNLEKYWTLRERLKNYVVVGSCTGCGIPALSREGSLIDWSDSGIRLGIYLSMLATEYKLLKDHGQTQKLAETKKELFYAMEAFNRLDFTAEGYWRAANNLGSATPVSSDLNGFFIRDDVHANFATQTVEARLVENHLSSSYFPFQNNLNLYSPSDNIENFESHTTISSGFTDGMAGNFGQANPAWLFPDDGFKGPKEESLDQANQLLMGLALIVKCVDPNDSYNNTAFAHDPTVSKFVQEAKRISRRIVKFMDDNNWLIKNPAISTGCVQGVFSTRSCVIGAPGGGNVNQYSWGFAMADANIQNDFSGSTSGVTFQNLTLANQATFNSFSTVSLNGEDEKVLNLGAISNFWGTTATKNAIEDRLYYPNVQREHVSMLFNILWGASINTNFFECMINSAPCYDRYARNPTYEWNGKCRVNDGVESSSYATEYQGIDYLLYFNMYNLCNSSYLGNSYQYISPKSLAFDNIVKTDNEWNSGQPNNNETSEKHFIAAQTISAGKVGSSTVGYHISNKNDPSASSPVGAPANVTFEAAKEIALVNGFSSDAGTYFGASIDPSIQSRSCTSDPSANIICSQCVNSGNEYQQSTSYNGEYKVYPIDGSSMYVSTPHNLYKISGNGGTGCNMFDIHGTAPNVYGNYIIGAQGFSRVISDVDYVNGYTLVSFTDGAMLKISGTGGTGYSMFDINESNSSTNPFSDNGSGYYVGDAGFYGGITQVEYFPDNQTLLIGFDNGKILKVLAPVANNPNGTGHNMFAVTESNSSCCPFNTLANYNYYVGEGWYSNSAVTYIYSLDANTTLICYANGLIQKVGGSSGNGVGNGGTGHSMFNGYILGTNTNVTAYVTKIIYLSSSSYLVCFSDGGILRNDLSGTGSGFMAVNWNGSSFSSLSGYYHYQGDMYANSAATDGFLDENGKLFITFSNGKLLKIGNINSSASNNMFAVTETSGGFATVPSYSYYEGSCNFGVRICQMTRVLGKTFIGLGNSVMLKLIYNPYGTGYNCLALSSKNSCMANLCGWYNLIGSEDFNTSSSYKSAYTSTTSPFDLADSAFYSRQIFNQAGSSAKIANGGTNVNKDIIRNHGILVSPNPGSGIFHINLLMPEMEGDFEVFDVLGSLVSRIHIDTHTTEYTVDLEGYAKGVYILSANIGGMKYTRRLVLR